MEQLQKYKVITKFKRDTRLFMTVTEMAKTYGLSHNMAYEIIHCKNFPVLWNGRKAYIIKNEVPEWFSNNIGLRL